MKNTIEALVFLTVVNLLTLLGNGLSAGTMQERVEERIKPVGSLCMVGEPCAAAQSVARSVLSTKRTGEEIYSSNCVACHASGAAGAPIVAASEASIAAWTPRIGKGIETLFANSIVGINAMPPKGLCMDCTEEDIKVTVCHMINMVFSADAITEEIAATCAAARDSN